jgi:mannose-6-phosphate isomerase
VVQGTASVTLDDVETDFIKGQVVQIPLEAAHRVANNTDQDLIFIEVQHGSYFGEDDIVRLSDDYGRG